MKKLLQPDPSLIQPREHPPIHDRALNDLAAGTPQGLRNDLMAVEKDEMSVALRNREGRTMERITQAAGRATEGDANFVAATASRRHGSSSILLKLQARWVTLLFIAAFLGLSAGSTFAAGAKSDGVSTTSASVAEPSGPTTIPVQEEHGPSQKAVEIGHIFGFPISNSMIVSLVVALSLIIFTQVATRRMKQVPDGAQNFLEWLVESLYGFLEGLLGPQLVNMTFWFFATIFIFILSANWLGLIPGVGTIGWGHATPHGFKIDQPWLRGANADVNMTMAMALVFFACWIVWALRENGPLGFLKELFAPKGESTGPLKVLLAVVFFAAGCLEIISILFRPVSLGFRLYGNTFAGENMLETMANLVPSLSWLIPIPFYFLELLVGIVQALVFMLLTAVFTLLICQHEAEGPAATHN